MKLTIGTKLIGGFLFVSLLVALAGGLGIYNVGVISDASDVISYEKYPIADMSMESMTDICMARETLAGFLLTENNEELKSLDLQYHDQITEFDKHLDAILKGDTAKGVIAVASNSDAARKVLDAQDLHEQFLKVSEEVIDHHTSHLEHLNQIEEIMIGFDNTAEQLENAFEQWESSLSAGQEIDKRIDAAMEAKAIMFQMKSIVEEYVALDRSSKTKLREEFNQLHQEFEPLKPFLPPEVTQKYQEFVDTASGGGKMFDQKDEAMKDDLENQEHMKKVDELGLKIDLAMDGVETVTTDDMKTAMDTADNAQNNARITLIVVTLAALLVGILIGTLLTRGITRPISQCVEFAQQVAKGDLSRQIEITTKDETRDLGNALNDMIAYLRGMAESANGIAAGDLSQNVKPASEHDVFGNAFLRMITNLREMVGRIRSASGSVASAAEEISAATDQITKGAQAQASAADETGSTMEEMSIQIQMVAKNAEGLASNVDETTSSIQQMGTTARGVANNAEAMAANVSETSSTIEQMVVTIEKTSKNVNEADQLSQLSNQEAKVGGEAVLKTVEGMKTISEMMTDISGVIQNLGSRSEAIGSIVEVIEEIADQTNLLALNAAIEAARAGDAGRGFAVVADEVRKLAERSIKATKEIGQVIKQVQTETAAAVKATLDGANTSKQGIELADQAGAAIGRIIESVNSASKIMQNISNSTSEQSAAAKNVIIAVEEMNRLTQSVTMSTKEQAAGIGQVVKAAEAMAQMTEQVKNATSEQKRGGENVVKAVENISDIAKSNLSAVSQLSRSAKDLASQSEGLQELVQEFKVA